MLSAIIYGLVIGLLMTVPVGPVGLYVFNTALKKNYRGAYFLALGSSLMDMLYLFIIISGFSLIHFSENNALIVRYTGILAMMVIGIKEIFVKPMACDSVSEVFIKRKSGFFILGVMLYATNPTIIATLSALWSFLKSLTLFDESWMNIGIFTFCAGIGAMMWFSFLVKMACIVREKMNQHHLKKINIVTGMVILIFSVYLAFVL